MSKCASRKTGGHQNGTILQTQEGSYEAETAGRFFLRFCVLFFRGTCHRRDTTGKEKRAEVASAQIRKKIILSRWDDTAGKSSRERQAPAPYAAVRVRCRSYGVSYILRSVAGRITGHRRSLPQPSSAAWCPPPLPWSRAYLPHVAAY